MKHLIVLIGNVLIGLLAAVFLMGAENVVDVGCGQDLDAIVNDNSPTATRFQLAGGAGGCTYTVDRVLALKNGDEIVGPAGALIERGPAFDPEPTVTIVAREGLSNVIRAEGKVHLEWVKIVGGTGQYSGGSPVAGTGSGLAMGMASNDSSLYAVHITGNDGAGVTNAHGTFDSIELSDTTQDPNFLGFIGSGLKAITEVEVRNSYIHDNQGNGLWCDQFCRDSDEQLHPHGFWIHDNLVVKSGRGGIRFERVGDVADAGEALIEDNEVHQNSLTVSRGGIDIRDAQNALVQNNVFGKTPTIYDVAYEPNANGVAIRATDSGRSDRPDLFNVDIVGNVLNGETIVGCEQPDEIVACSDAPSPPPPPPSDTTAPQITITTPPQGATYSLNQSVAASYECTDADSGVASCQGPVTNGDNIDTSSTGTKTFTVDAKDNVGNTNSVSHTYTVNAPTTPGGDTTPPTVVSTVPGSGATGVSPSINNVKATFSEAMDASTTDGDPSTITPTTFMLFPNASTTQVAAKVSYDSSTRTAKLNPNNNLQRGVTYRAVLTTGVQDVAGNPLAQQKEWLFTVKR